MKSVILIKDKSPYSKISLTTTPERFISFTKKVGIDFHVVVSVIEAISIVASITGKIET